MEGNIPIRSPCQKGEERSAIGWDSTGDSGDLTIILTSTIDSDDLFLSAMRGGE